MSGSAERFFKVRNYYWYNLLFWLILCILEVIQSISFSHTFGQVFDTGFLIRWPLSVYLSYWFLSLLVIRAYISTSGFKPARFALWHIPGSLVFGIVHKLLHPFVALLLERLFLSEVTLPLVEIGAMAASTYYDFLSGTAMYWLLVLILRALTYYQRFQEKNSRYLELEAELGNSRLHAMKIQMKPHFLFNAFNTISMMIRGDKRDEAIIMISDLSEMLRSSLSTEARQLIKLGDEIELTRKYVNIESGRYGDRVSVEWEIDPDTTDQMIPSMLIQPLVENAFKHGISKSLKPELIRISCKNVGGKLRIEVFNTGSELSPDWDFQRSKGIGLSNTSERLSRLYNSGVKLLIDQRAEGISVSVEIPLDE